MALMEYLRKCTKDSEKMEMVALKFEMYRELARTREERGQIEGIVEIEIQATW